MKKINWRNVIKSITFVFCIGVILHDIWLVGFSYLFTGASCSFTWYGLITFIFMLIISDFIYEDKEPNKKYPKQPTKVYQGYL